MIIGTLILVVIIYSLLCWYVSSFFINREVGRINVFIVSLILSPLFGILIGLSSNTVTNKKNTQSDFQNYKNELVDRMVKLSTEIKSKRELDIPVRGEEENLKRLKSIYDSLSEEEYYKRINDKLREKYRKGYGL